MESKSVVVQMKQNIAIITLNRPEVRNAINLEMVDGLNKVLDQMEHDPEVKVIIFTGSGEHAFISGGDLKQFHAAKTKEEALPMLVKVGDLLTRIQKLKKPTIAMINGTAVGGGCEFAASCDFRFASDHAKLGFVQISLHITTGWGGASRLIRKIGRTNALRLLLTGEVMGAEQAMACGFVDKVFPREILLEQTYAFAEKIANQPLEGIMAYMMMAHDYDEGLGLESSIEKEIDRCSDLWGSSAHAEIVQTFLHRSKKQ
jgi:enoyl-CoA hydratase/carnithine racemase